MKNTIFIWLVILITLSFYVVAQSRADISINLIQSNRPPFNVGETFTYEATLHNNNPIDSANYDIEHTIKGPNGAIKKEYTNQILGARESKVYREEFAIDAAGSWSVSIKVLSLDDPYEKNNQAALEFTSYENIIGNKFIQKSTNRNLVLSILIAIFTIIVIMFVNDRIKDLNKHKKSN